jgi:protein TonB
MSVRMALALPAAALIALLLFRLMHALISSGEGLDGAVVRGGTLDFIRVAREEAVPLRSPTVVPEPPEVAPPPPRPPMQTGEPVDSLQPRIEMPAAGFQWPAHSVGYPAGFGSAGDGVDRDVVPLVRVDPQWPREALLSGAEGWVLIEFMILEDGSVADARVIESSPGRLFDRSALRAISRWRFHPRIIDGEPTQRRARQRFDFVHNDAQ